MTHGIVGYYKEFFLITRVNLRAKKSSFNIPYHNPERAALKPLINTNYLSVDTATKITVMLKDRYFMALGLYTYDSV